MSSFRPNLVAFFPYVILLAQTHASAIEIHPKAADVTYKRSIQFRAVGAPKPYGFSIVTGSGTIDSLTGKFTAAESGGTAIVRATDAYGNSSDATVRINPPPEIIPKEKTLTGNSTLRFSAQGGAPPFQYSIASGGGVIDSTTGVYTAPPENGTAKIQLADSVGNISEATVTVLGSLSLTPPSGNVTLGKRLVFQASGGLPPYTYTLHAGGGSVDGSSGEYTAPETSGAAEIEVTDSLGAKQVAEITIRSLLMAYPISRFLVVGDSFRIEVTGGVPPYSFKKLSGVGAVDSATGWVKSTLQPETIEVEVKDQDDNKLLTQVNVAEKGPGLKKLAAGYGHTCAIVGKGVQCWGDNRKGQLGNPSAGKQSWMPVEVQGLPGEGLVSITTGMAHSCALISGAVKCWGDNSKGQLGAGPGAPQNSGVPLNVYNLGRGVQSIAAGQDHTCAVKDSGVLCWGNNGSGQLGIGNKRPSSIPVQAQWVSGGVVGVGAGAQHSCALLESGAQCWGYGQNGALGNGYSDSHTRSVPVKGVGNGLRRIETGGFHNCVSDGVDLRCWGYNGSGQLGLKSVDNQLSAKGVQGLSGQLGDYSTGHAHTCAIGDLKLKCWGHNYYGQVGDGGTDRRTVPVVVQGLDGEVLEVAAGFNHTCARTGEGVRCWGDNSFQQLGERLGSLSRTPAQTIKFK